MPVNHANPVSRAGFALAVALLLSACGDGGEAGGDQRTEPFDGIAAGETVLATGGPPVWTGEVRDSTFIFGRLERAETIRVPVERFAGNNGLSFTGELDGRPVLLMVTPGECNDGMSEVLYPYVATLDLAGERHEGCAWTDAQPAA